MKKPIEITTFTYDREPERFSDTPIRYAFNPIGYSATFKCMVCNEDFSDNLFSNSNFWLYEDEFIQEGNLIKLFCCQEHKEIYRTCPV